MRIDNLPSRTRHLMRSPQNGKAILISIDSLGTFRKTSLQAANVVNVRRSLKCCRFESWYNVSSVDDDAVYSHWTESQQYFFYDQSSLTSRITHLNIRYIPLSLFVLLCAVLLWELFHAHSASHHIFIHMRSLDIVSWCYNTIVEVIKWSKLSYNVRFQPEQKIDSCWATSQTIKINAKCFCNQINCNAPMTEMKRR